MRMGINNVASSMKTSEDCSSMVSTFSITTLCVLDVERCRFIEAMCSCCPSQSSSFTAEIVDHVTRKKLSVL